MRKAAIAKKYRNQAKENTESAEIETDWKTATLQATFYHAQKRRRDSLNFMASLKSAIDGIVDAGLIPDDHSEILTPLPPVFKIDKESPRVELLFSRTS